MRKRIIFIVAVCVVLIGVTMSVYVGGNAENVSVLKPHRQEFTSGIESDIAKQFKGNEEVKKAYLLLTNEWYLSEELYDFSQVVTTDTMYVAEDVTNGYSFYEVDKDGELQWKGNAYPPVEVAKPFGFYGLTYEMVDGVLEGMEYEEYIFTYSQRLRTVFIWVRGKKEDVIITYPTRPDLLGLEVSGVYDLAAVKEILSTVYAK